MTSSALESVRATGATPPSIAIVMPAYQAAEYLRTTVPAALAAARGSTVLVVDAGSSDDTAAVAERLGASVLRVGHRAGPAEARNVGTAAIDTDVVLFIDSDCVAHPDVVERVRVAFAADDRLVSLTGSYDDSPPFQGFFSQYMNLRHHRTHQLAKQDDASFWAGCGAVRVDAFRSAGGFDAVRYPRPMIEDIDLGLRLRRFGATRLDPGLHVTHLKRWTLASVVATDIKCRAVPWTRLLAERGGMPNDLNLRTSQRIAALVALPALLAVAALPVLAYAAPSWTPLPAALIALSLALNFDLVRFFARRRGALFAVGGWMFHQVHLVYSAVTFAIVSAQVALSRSGARERGPA